MTASGKLTLTLKQEAFSRAYVETKNASEAYRRSYDCADMKEATIRRKAKYLMDNPKIKARIAELGKAAADKHELTVERVLKEMMALGFYDMTEILETGADGKITMKDPRELPEDLRRAMVSIKPVEIGGAVYFECKFADKQKALNDLGRHLQMFKDTVVIENVFRVVRDMEDDELDRRIAELERAIAQATAIDPTPGAGPASVH